MKKSLNNTVSNNAKGFKGGFQEPSISTEALQVLRLLGTTNYTTKSIAKHLNKSVQAVNKHKRKLKELGFLDEFLGVSRAGFKSMGYHSTSKEYRIHGVQVFYELPIGTEKAKWKKNRGRVLSLKKIEWDSIILRNKSGITDRAPRFHLFDKFECRAHANGVMVYFPEIFGITPTVAELQLLKLIEKVGLELNGYFGIDFFKDNSLRVRILKYEIAHLNDSVASVLRKEKKKLYIRLGGELRFICDFSWSIDEMEGVTVDYGLEDQHAAQGYIKNILKEGNAVLLPSDVKELFEKQARINSERSKAELLLAKNIESHVRIVKEIGASAEELKLAVMELRKEKQGLFEKILNFIGGVSDGGNKRRKDEM